MIGRLRMKKIVVYGLLCFALIGCGNESTSSTSAPIVNDGQPFDAPFIDNTEKLSYLDAINTARASEQNCGSEGIKPAVSALVWNEALYTAAYEHSEDLAESDTFSHTGSGTTSDWTSQVQNLGRGSTTKERIENNGYVNWSMIGENIAAGTTTDTAPEVVQQWLDSPSHCANLMNENYTEVGMAMVANANSYYVHYWTQNFGKPQ